MEYKINGAVFNNISAAIKSFGLLDLETGGFTPPDVAVVRPWAVDAVNQWAGEQRSRNATNIPFQDSVYAEKEAEALLCLADPGPLAADYPYCEIERGIIEAAYGSCTLHQAAGFITQVATEKRAASIVIEAKRRTVGAAVATAASVEEIEAALVGLE